MTTTKKSFDTPESEYVELESTNLENVVGGNDSSQNKPYPPKGISINPTPSERPPMIAPTPDQRPPR